jgi:hypothetical protein
MKDSNSVCYLLSVTRKYQSRVNVGITEKENENDNDAISVRNLDISIYRCYACATFNFL